MLQLKCDPQLIEKSKVDGSALAKFSTISSIRTKLGIRLYGHACFTLRALQHGIVDDIHITTISPFGSLAPVESDVGTWSLDRVCQWLHHSDLSVLESAFRRHDLIGQAVICMNAEEFANIEDDAASHSQELHDALARLLPHGALLWVFCG